MFVVTVVFDVEPGEGAAFLARVQQQARDSLEKEPDCHRFDVSVCTKMAERVLLYEIYENADAFTAHLDSDHFKAFDRDVAPIIRSKDVQSWALT